MTGCTFTQCFVEYTDSYHRTTTISEIYICSYSNREESETRFFVPYNNLSSGYIDIRELPYKKAVYNLVNKGILENGSYQHAQRVLHNF